MAEDYVGMKVRASEIMRIVVIEHGNDYEKASAAFDSLFLAQASVHDAWEMFKDVRGPVKRRLFNTQVFEQKKEAAGKETDPADRENDELDGGGHVSGGSDHHSSGGGAGSASASQGIRATTGKGSIQRHIRRSNTPRISAAKFGEAVGTIKRSPLETVHDLSGMTFALLDKAALQRYGADETTPIINRAYARLLAAEMPGAGIAKNCIPPAKAEELYQQAVASIRSAA